MFVPQVLIAMLMFVNVESLFINKISNTRVTSSYCTPNNEVSLDIPLGEGLKPLPCKFKKIFSNSIIVMHEYPVPFTLDVEKPPRNFPAPIFKSSKNPGKEEAGDLLRAVTCWSQGFNAAGATSDFSSFAGNLKWRKSVYDCTSMQWEKVVEALISNTSERSKSVILVLEREIE